MLPGVVADLNSITTHTAGTLSLGGTGRAAGTLGVYYYSAATNQNDIVILDQVGSGIITVSPPIDNDFASYGTTGDVGRYNR